MNLKTYTFIIYPLYLYLGFFFLILLSLSMLFLIYHLNSLQATIDVLNVQNLKNMEQIENLKEQIEALHKQIKETPVLSETIRSPVDPIIHNYSFNEEIIKYILIILAISILLYWGNSIYLFLHKTVIVKVLAFINTQLTSLVMYYLPLETVHFFQDKNTNICFQVIIEEPTKICRILIKRPGDLIYANLDEFMIKTTLEQNTLLNDLVSRGAEKVTSSSVSLSTVLMEAAAAPDVFHYSNIVVPGF